MTSQEIQKEFIRAYLKPTLKAYGYKTSGRTWWKDNGDFFIVINLQTSQWSSKEELSFRLNIGVGLTDGLADKKKVTIYDTVTHLGEMAYLTEERQQLQKKRGGWLGYKITNVTDVAEFIDYFKVDLEDNILKKLNGLKTLKDCIAFYDKFAFWGEQLRRQIGEYRMVVE